MNNKDWKSKLEPWAWVLLALGFVSFIWYNTTRTMHSYDTYELQLEFSDSWYFTLFIFIIPAVAVFRYMIQLAKGNGSERALRVACISSAVYYILVFLREIDYYEQFIIPMFPSYPAGTGIVRAVLFVLISLVISGKIKKKNIAVIALILLLCISGYETIKEMSSNIRYKCWELIPFHIMILNDASYVYKLLLDILLLSIVRKTESFGA